MSRVAIAFPRSPGATGGAEVFVEGLARALAARGHEVDLVAPTVDESSFEGILAGYAAFDALDLGAHDVVVSTKAPSYAVRHRRHVLYLVHTMRVFYDRFAQTFPRPTREREAQREVVHALDRALLDESRFVARFAIGETPVARVREALPRLGTIETLHCPPDVDGPREPRAGRHLLAPGRLHPWKRLDLLVRAFRRVDRDVPLRIVGTGEAERALRALAAGDRRIEIGPPVERARLFELYRDAIGVAFPAVGEDLGLVVLEAFAFAKPVLTCADSGEPTRLVRDGSSGLVVPATEDAVAAALTRWIDDPLGAAAMGRRGEASIRHLDWGRVVERIEHALERSRRRPTRRRRRHRVLVAGTQPIEPPIGARRLRLRNLYGALGDDVETTYVGSFPSRAAGRRTVAPTPGLLEIDVPLERAHFDRHERIARRLPGRQTFDVSLPFLLAAEAALPAEVAARARAADVVVLSHPSLYPSLREELRARDATIVYDAQDGEAGLGGDLLGAEPLARALAEGARQIEAALCRESHAILAASEEDRVALAVAHGVSREKIHVVPNAIDGDAIRPADPLERAEARRRLGVDGFVALFVGSDRAPNHEGLEAIRGEIAPASPDVTFLVVGGVGDRARRGGDPAPANLRILGTVPDAVRADAYAAADVALNPMRRGPGADLKTLESFAAGLATIATPIGGRGLPTEAFVVAEVPGFAAAIARLRAEPERRRELGARARRAAEQRHAAAVSAALGGMLRRLRPFFTVVVPTCDRAEALATLIGRLERQTFPDFEVVVVDQSAPPVPDLLAERDLVGVWRHETVRGAARARNAGARHARGRVLAFTDDDCLPQEDWLERAHARLSPGTCVGLEGRVVCDQSDWTRFRVVTNAGVEGIGFMTANLFVRRDVFEMVGGFDERFDDPHFREDTDLGWRCLAFGAMPHASDVCVRHPAEPRERAAIEQRSHFFQQDALLFAKHPERYLELLAREQNHRRYPSFWREFASGIRRHRVTVDVAELSRFAGPAFAELRAAWEEIRSSEAARPGPPV